MARLDVVHGEGAVGHVGRSTGHCMEKIEAVSFDPAGGLALVDRTGVLRGREDLEGTLRRDGDLHLLDRSALRQGQKPSRPCRYLEY